MASFGQNLRQAREARNITLQEIAATTKIGTRSLQSLESDRFDLLPGGIFNKGFVRAYARCVGLDEEKTIAAYLVAANVTPPETDMQTLASQVTSAREANREPWWDLNAGTFVGILAVIVALVLGALWLKEHRKEARELAEEQARVSASTAISNPPAATVVASAPDAAGNPAVNGTASGTANVAPDTALAAGQNLPQNAVQGAAQSTGQAGTPAAGGTSPAVAALKETAAPVEISISATSRAWISVRSDGKTVETVTLDPEKPETRTRSYKAREKVVLIMGNPAGVSVIYNGKPAGTLGTAGRRNTITFTPQGIDKQ